MDSIDCAKLSIRAIISGSGVPEDPLHAENTLEWLLKLDPAADQALQIAALAHDIERAVEAQKVRREDFKDYNNYEGHYLHHSIKTRTEIQKIKYYAGDIMVSTKQNNSLLLACFTPNFFIAARPALMPKGIAGHLCP